MQPLADAATVAGELAGDRPPALLDVRWRLGGPPGVSDYLAGHLPGAVYVDLDADLAGPPGRAGRHPLPGPEAFQAAMRRAGVRGDRGVVVYDEADSMAAARAWWLLRYFGHPAVRVLDGGYLAWVAAGYPVAAGPEGSAAGHAPRTGDFTARQGGMPLLDADAVAAVARQGVLLDARAGERYRGEAEPLDPVAGHIPGAVSAPAAGNLAADGRFRTAAALRERFAAVGADGRAGPVGCYCGSGVTAAQQVLALEIAGIPAALYAGSWSEWVAGAGPGRPVATGSEPG
ncbi:MAG TPA: sulfurtransferase [Streptosporangiaceae bacterium]|nr:sulfurtransferase [Streptosporangiaceae bacterium]